MKTTLSLIIILLSLIIFNFYKIFYFNIFTHSLPYGVYMMIKGDPQRGDYAASCLRDEIARYGIDRRYLEQGDCDTGAVRILKMIKGIPGDHFVVKNGLLQLNGHSYRIMDKDSSGRVLKIFYKQKEGVLEKNKYLLLSDFVENSWDSRYWGPMGIEFLLKPLYTINSLSCVFD